MNVTGKQCKSECTTKWASTMCVCASSFNPTTCKKLEWYSGLIHVRHHLTGKEFQRWLDFAKWFIRTCQNDRIRTNVVVGVEAHLSNTVGKFVMFEFMRYRLMRQILRLKKRKQFASKSYSSQWDQWQWHSVEATVASDKRQQISWQIK